MIGMANKMLSAAVDALLRHLCLESPWPGMLALSLLASVAGLAVVKLTANAPELRRRRNRMMACILEIALFRYDPVLTLDGLRRAVAANSAYMRSLFLPLLAGLLPMALLAGQIHDWFACRPLRLGETAVVTARVDPSVDLLAAEPRLRTSEAVFVDSEAVRVPRQGEISWRVRARHEGIGWVNVEIGGQEFGKTIAVGRTMARNPEMRVVGGLAGQFLHPSESPLPANGPIRSITVGFPPREFRVGGVSLNWLAAYLLSSLLFSGLLMRPMRVTM